jgi:hypothetical protein
MELAADLDITIGENFWSPRWAVVLWGAAVDLTDGWTVNAQIRPYAAASTVLHEFQGAVGVNLGTVPVVIGGEQTTTSTVQFYIPATVTERFTEWVGVWDWRIEHPERGPNATPYVRTMAGGKVETHWSVTR